MAKSHDVTADWRVIEPSTLPDDLHIAYELYREAYKAARTAREAFEVAMTKAAQLPDTQRLVFGYNFGKLSIAVVPNDKRPTRTTAPAATLADFLRSSAAMTGARR